MNAEQFAFWLNGYVELTEGAVPSEAQWASIVEHLGTCFNKITKTVDDHRKVQILEEEDKSPGEPYREKDLPKESTEDFVKRFKEIFERTHILPQETVPYQYPPFNPHTYPSQPGWPGISPTYPGIESVPNWPYNRDLVITC